MSYRMNVLNMDELCAELGCAADVPLDMTFTVDGPPLTHEHLIIGALVKRLGGSVTLDASELESVQGVVFDNPVGATVTVKAG
jgi:hypothetical protein